MPDELAIRAAERAKIEAAVAEHGTAGELFDLAMSKVRRGCVTVHELAAAHEEGGADLLGRLDADSGVLSRLARRLELRQRLGLDAKECASEQPTPGCNCLSDTLDLLASSKRSPTRAKALEAARRLHRKRWPNRKPPPQLKPTPPRPIAESKAPAKPGPPPEPKGEAAAARVVGRTRRWYDDAERPIRFFDMKF